MHYSDGTTGSITWRPKSILGARRASISPAPGTSHAAESVSNSWNRQAGRGCMHAPAFSRPPPPVDFAVALNSSTKPCKDSHSPTVLLFDEQAQKQHRIWIAQIAAGETHALTALHRDLAPFLHGIARRILSNDEDVREVVQDAFIKAWRQASNYRPELGEVYSWMLYITRNQSIDRLRQSNRRAALVESLQLNDETEDGVDPDDGFDQRDMLDRSLANLSASQRQALELAFFSGCTQAEIAAAMRTQVGNVKNHLRRGLLKLRQFVHRHE
ncbi:MAG: RNA polymerase sigma factor [Opitutaceae bacterium]|nr:RNA polymerase sigma factor [Opitutaceae bacterium]